MFRSKNLSSVSRKIHMILFVRNSSNGNILHPAKNITFGGYALLAVPIGTFCLGTWQVKRRSWKLRLIQELEEKTSSAPVDLPDDLNELSKMEYMNVRVRGTFDHSKEMYIGPRSLVSKTNGKEGGIFSITPQSGNHVITPFHLSDQNLTILVNRGWVPRQKTSPEKRLEGQVENEIELVGVVRLQEERPVFSPKNNPETNYFYFRDLQEMASKCDAVPVLIDADYQSSVPGGPIGGQTRVILRNEHLSYIITWYCLSAASAWIWYKRLILRLSVL